MSLLRILHDEMRPLFYHEIGSDPWRTSRLPNANIQETDSAYTIHLLSPGLSRSDFKITVGSNYITVKADVEKSNTPNQFVSEEYSYSSFERSWKLPADSNEDAITAKYQAGILQIEVPKLERQPQRKVIQVE